MDRSDPDLVLDERGLCNFCIHYDDLVARGTFDPSLRQARLDTLLADMKRRSRGRPYDCVIGLSGGADSSYAAYVASKLGLRCLAVHLDNGWNSELSVMNIECIVRRLGLDLVTHVIDWEEFRDVQLSLIRASVIDIELVTDHAILAALFAAARKHRAKFILTGDNYQTEVTLPRTWNHRKTDLRNLRAIHRRYGSRSMKTVPQMSTLRMMAQQRLLGVTIVPLLGYVDYVKADAIATLERELGWRPYGHKHYESIFTRFYQGYLLPRKFGIDKRRIHFSRLICSGQMTREEAVTELTRAPYRDARQLESDREFVLKKLGLSEAEFARILAEPPRPHAAFATDDRVVELGIRLKAGVRQAAQRALVPARKTRQALVAAGARLLPRGR